MCGKGTACRGDGSNVEGGKPTLAADEPAPSAATRPPEPSSTQPRNQEKDQDATAASTADTERGSLADSEGGPGELAVPAVPAVPADFSWVGELEPPQRPFMEAAMLDPYVQAAFSEVQNSSDPMAAERSADFLKKTRGRECRGPATIDRYVTLRVVQTRSDAAF